MTAPPSLASLLEFFFRHRLTKQRNASRSTIASYRDALRLLILFAAERTRAQTMLIDGRGSRPGYDPRLSGRT